MTLASFFLYGAAAVLVGCRREAPAQRHVTVKTTTIVGRPADLRKAKVNEVLDTDLIEKMTTARLGNHVTPEGVVTDERNTFKAGDPVILSMVITQSPGGLEMSAIWRDGKGKIVEEDRKRMNGAKIATFAYSGKPFKPGQYRVTGYWGGNIAAEKKFRVTK
jgi:hypothetical protein